MKYEKILQIFNELWDQRGANGLSNYIREEYIESLRSRAEKARDIPKNLKQAEAKDALEVFSVYDPQLEIFEKYLKRYYDFNARAYKWIPLPQISDEDKKKIKSSVIKKFEPSESTEWSMSEVEHTVSRSIFKYTRQSHKVVKATLVKSEITDDAMLKKICEKGAEKVHAATAEVAKIIVSLTIPGISVVEVEFDWEEELISIAVDAKDADEENYATPNEINNVKRSDILGCIVKDLEIGISAPTIRSIASMSGIGKAVLADLRSVNAGDTLVVVRVGDFRIEDGLNQIIEDVRSTIVSTTEAIIHKAAEDYFKENNSFEGFFEKNMAYSPINAKVQGPLLADNSAESHGLRGYFLHVVPNQAEQGTPQARQYLYRKKIEVLSFEYREETDEWIIKNRHYSKQVHEAFLHKVLEFYRKPSRPKRPTKR